MNRYTMIVQADVLKKVIPIPSEFEHMELEVIIGLPERKKVDIRSYNSIFQMTKEEVDCDLKSMRDDWNIHER